MTSLEQELSARDISTYKLTRLLGEDPKKKTSLWQRRMKGKESITPEDLRRICQAVSKFKPDAPLEPADIDTKILRFEVK